MVTCHLSSVIGHWVARWRFLAAGLSAAVLSMFGSAPILLAAASTSTDYTITHQVLDLGGERAESGDYANHGSFGGSGGPTSDSADYAAPHGFIGQIHDAPIVTIGVATDLTRTEGTVHGSVNPNSLASTAWFEYGPTAAFGTSVPLANLDAGTVAEAVSAVLSSLAPGSGYHFRLVASNADGTVQSAGQEFTTVVNLPPGADPVTLERLRDLSVKVLVSELLSGAIDPEGDSTVFDGAATVSANGGQIYVSGGWVLYYPPQDSDEADSFTYTISDSFGAETTGIVNVVIRGDGGAPTLNIRGIEALPDSGGQVRIRFVGVPGRTYQIQATGALNEPWVTISTSVADVSGLYEYIDEDAGSFAQRFYRAVRE